MSTVRRTVRLLGACLLLGAMVAVSAQGQSFDVAIYYPGYLGGNPVEPPITIGAQLVREAFDDVTVRIVEGGAASEWETGLMTLAASGGFDLIITFTDGMPQILEAVTGLFPEQRWALLDASAPGQSNVYSLVYSDEALGFLGGAFAALLATDTSLSRDPQRPTVGLLAGTPYPAMDQKIHPGFRAGARYVEPSINTLFAAVGDWNNPNRARDLASNMFGRGATAIMSITGGGDTGVHRAAAEAGAYAIAVNTNQNAMAPGVILASVLKRIDTSILSVVQRAREGSLPYGSVEAVGIAEGAISLAEDALFEAHVPAAVRERMAEIIAGLESGAIDHLALLEAERID